MAIYGDAAVLAARAIQSNPRLSPREAWDKAMVSVTQSAESRKKGCPRGAFLGLCASGSIVGVNPDPAVDGGKNASYALAAVEILRREPRLAEDKVTLWDRVKPEQDTKHNCQMDVVLALWNAGLIASSI